MIHPAGAGDRADKPGSEGEHHLQEHFGTEARADRFYDEQVCDQLLPAMVEFVERMPMMFVATADAHGECDSSLRAGPPGFVQVLDDRHVAYPEYRGNGVMASLGNIAENPHVGLLMVDFTEDLIGLHVNGSARIVDDAELRAEHPDLPTERVPGRRTDTWVLVEVEEAYIHCRKHIPRMQEADRRRPWGTDDSRRKGGDFFGAAAAHRAEAEAPAGAVEPAAEPTVPTTDEPAATTSSTPRSVPRSTTRPAPRSGGRRRAGAQSRG